MGKNLGNFLSYFILFLDLKLSLNLELTDELQTSSQGAQGICLIPSSEPGISDNLSSAYTFFKSSFLY